MDAQIMADEEAYSCIKETWMGLSKSLVHKDKDTDARKNRPIYRKTTVEMLYALDGGLRNTTNPSIDLRYYFLDPDPLKRPSDPLSWPRLDGAGDRGGDNMCAVGILIRRFHANFVYWPDESHDMKNDLKGVLKATHRYKWAICMISGLNCFHSPYWEHVRFNQVKDAIAEALSSLNEKEDFIFQDLFPRILRDRGEEDRMCEPDIERTVYNEMPVASAFWVVNERASLMKFLNLLMSLEREDPSWHTKLYGMLTALLMLGELGSQTNLQFGAAVMKALKKLEGAGDKDTIKAGDAELKVAKDHAGNQLHFAAMLYSDPQNQNAARALITASRPALTAWSNMNRAQRSIADSHEWLLQECSGGFWKYCKDTILELTSTEKCEYIGMSIVTDIHLQGEVNLVQVASEDSLAKTFMCFSIQWVGQRIKRRMHILRGYPYRFCLLAAGDDWCADTIARFRKDVQRYETLQARERCKAAKILFHRSLFETPAVQQYMLALTM
jgi:hypothetical protein